MAASPTIPVRDGKGGRSRVVPAHPELVEAFRSIPKGRPNHRVFLFSPRTSARWISQAGLYAKSRKKNGCHRSGAMQPVAGAGRIFTVRSIAYVHTTGRGASNRIRVDSGARGHHSPRCDGLGHPALGTQPCRQH